MDGRSLRLVRVALALVLAIGISDTGVVQAQATSEAETPTEPSASAPPVEAQVSSSPMDAVTLGTVPIPFSVVGPLTPEDSRLVLLTGERSCGVGFRDPQVAATHVVETEETVAIRIDATLGPHGEPCRTSKLSRVPIRLAEPLGERTVLDASRPPGRTPYVNPFAPIDTGFRYACDGFDASISDLVGPGLDVAGHGPQPNIQDARAVVDTGDVIEYIGTLERGAADWESWWFHEGRWEWIGSGICRPGVVLPPGLEGATWSLRGRRPGPGSRRVRVWVEGQSCSSGRSPAGRIARPIVQVRPRSIVIILGVEPLRGTQDCQGAPPAPYVVRLPVALGDRALYDGGVYPPKDHPRRTR